MRKRLIALLAGLMYPFGFAPYDIWPLVLASIATLFWLLRDQSPRHAALTGLCYGLGLFGFGVSWLYVSIHTYGYTPAWLSVILTGLFCAGMALYFAILGAASATLGHRALAFAGLWLLLDWARGWFLTGFPWLYPGYAMIDTPLAGWAPVGGIWLISLATVFSSLALVALLDARKQWPLITLAIALWLAAWPLSPRLWTTALPDDHQVALVQGNIPQDLKWLTTQQDATREIYAELTASITQPALVVWPESAITEFYQDANDFLMHEGKQVADEGGTLVSGIPWRVSKMSGYQYHNSIAVIDGGRGVYHKQKLVPFGEYVPLQDLLRGIIPFFDLPMSSFTRGLPDQENLAAGPLTIAPFICYEVLYPELVASRSHDASVLLTVSNDAWFGTSNGPLQHFQMTRMRALETGRWLLRDTNNGVTAVVDDLGRVRAQLPQFERGVLQTQFEARTGSTPFMYTGGAPIWVLAALLCLPALRQRWRHRHEERDQ